MVVPFNTWQAREARKDPRRKKQKGICQEFHTSFFSSPMNIVFCVCVALLGLTGEKKQTKGTSHLHRQCVEKHVLSFFCLLLFASCSLRFPSFRC